MPEPQWPKPATAPRWGPRISPGALRGVRWRSFGPEAVREWLTVGPDRSILEEFFLPDGHRLLEGVDEPAAGVEGRCAVRREDGDQDARFANFQMAEAMDERDIADGEPLADFGRQLLHLAQRHGLVGLVFEIAGGASVAVIAHDAVEDGDGSILGALERGNDVVGNDAVVDDADVWGVRLRLGGRVACPAADRREQRHLVALAQRVAGGDVFLVHGYGDRRPGKAGDHGPAALQQVGDGRARWHLQRIAGGQQVAQHSEGKQAHAHRNHINGPILPWLDDGRAAMKAHRSRVAVATIWSTEIRSLDAVR